MFVVSSVKIVVLFIISFSSRRRSDRGAGLDDSYVGLEGPANGDNGKASKKNSRSVPPHVCNVIQSFLPFFKIKNIAWSFEGFEFLSHMLIAAANVIPNMNARFPETCFRVFVQMCPQHLGGFFRATIGAFLLEEPQMSKQEYTL